MLRRTDILNYLIKKYGYKTYLEIGLSDATHNHDLIQAPVKVAVDPEPLKFGKNSMTYLGTSDRFFATPHGLKFDLVFIDGLHQNLQVRRDIENSLACLNTGGTIMMHDCLPPTEIEQTEEPDWEKSKSWYGTAWKAFAHYRMTRHDLNMFTINTDCGCGIIREGFQNCFPQVKEEELTYEFFLKNVVPLMNIKSVGEAVDLL